MPTFAAEDQWTVVRRRKDRRGGRDVTSDRRSPRRTSYPSRNGRRTYASVVRGRDHRDERDVPHTWQRNRVRERPSPDRYAARHRVWTERERRFERGPAQNRRYVKHTRSERSEPPNNKIPSDDPDFSTKVRIIHRLIKSVHHLKNVSKDAYPPSLNKIAQNLMTVIKPAVPNGRTRELIEGNARNWAHTSIIILRQHYSGAIEEEVNNLFEFPIQEWRGPFEVATSWAKRNLGRRLQSESLEQTQAIIVSKLADRQADTRPAKRGNTPSEPTRQPEVSEDLIQLDSNEPLVEILQPAPLHGRTATPQPNTTRATTITAQIHAPPARGTVTMATAATMTDPIRGDWSPCIERGGEEDGDPRPPTPPEISSEPEPEPTSPKDQRVRRVLAALHVTSTGEKSPPPIQPSQPAEEIEVLDLTQQESTPTKSKTDRRMTPKSPTASHSRRQRTTEDRLRSCVQTRLQTRRIEESSLSPPSSPASPAQQVHAPTRHPNTQRKLQDWSLHIRETSLIIGDSNVSTLPSFSARGVQIDSFPGAKWCHAQSLLEKATCDEPVETLVLSFGLNNRSQRDKNTPVTDLKKTLKTAQERCPEADIYIPVVNFSTALPHNEQETLLYLNSFIAGLDNHIPALPTSMFNTEKDNIHWTDKTAMCMLSHWNDYVNGESP
ncbi:antigen [Sarotherodon galilaeus]